jgi:hypothetical protein
MDNVAINVGGSFWRDRLVPARSINSYMPALGFPGACSTVTRLSHGYKSVAAVGGRKNPEQPRISMANNNAM